MKSDAPTSGISRPQRRAVVVALIVALLLLFLLVKPDQAQPTTTIQGQVTFEDGSPAPGVQVTLEGPARPPQSTVTDEEGRFVFRDVAPGPYRAISELEGFASQAHHFEASVSRSADLQLVVSGTEIEEDIVVTADSAAARPAEISWNAWAEIPDARQPEPLLRLEEGQTYHVFLDLSPFAHRRAGMVSATADSTLRDELRRVFDEGKTTHLTLKVQPILEGGVLEPPQDGLQPATWKQGEWRDERSGLPVRTKVRLGNLFESPHRLDETAADWRRAADRARAAGLRITVEARNEGCGVIAYSIWDEKLQRPLDHVLHTVAVGNAQCTRTGQLRNLDAGFVQMLRAPTEERVAAALHLFEVASDYGRPAITLAVYVPRKQVGACRIFSWQRTGKISEFFLEDTSFADSLNKARTDKDWDGYADLASQVRNRLFPPDVIDGATGCGGWAALQDLRRLSRQPGRTLYVRLVDFGHFHQLVPLGLLFALPSTQDEGAQPFFAEDVTVRQALPHRSQGNGKRCIGDWRLVLPEKLSGYDEIHLPPKLKDYAPRTSRIEIGRRFEDLQAALTGESTESEPGVPGRGLVVLAHHAGNTFYFLKPGSIDDLSRKSGVWRADNIGGRHFPRGSVAIISACETGDLSHDASVVRALNAAGVDAVILSPFAVDTRFGVALALNFSELVIEAQDRQNTATLADLYDDAMDRTVKNLEGDLGSRARGMAREFLLAGDADIPLCPSPPA